MSIPETAKVSYESVGRTELTILMCSVPFWQLAGKLRALSLHYVEPELGNRLVNEIIIGNKIETSIEDVEAQPLALSHYLSRLNSSEKLAKEALHVAIAGRTAVAAAKAGHLKRLELKGFRCHYYLAIPALLPCWVRIEDWARMSTMLQACGKQRHSYCVASSCMPHADRIDSLRVPLQVL